MRNFVLTQSHCGLDGPTFSSVEIWLGGENA